MKEDNLIARYEKLRRRARELDTAVGGIDLGPEAEAIDAELVELERRLPAGYGYPGNPNNRG